MRPWPRRAKRAEPPALTADQWLAGIRRVVDGATINHQHTVKQEPVPPPVGGEVVIKRMDGSDAWRGHIYPGRGYLTMLDVPLANINPKFSPAEYIRFEFRWER